MKASPSDKSEKSGRLPSEATEGPKAADELASSERDGLFATAFQLSPDGMVVVRLDDSTVIEANEAFCRHCGCERDAVLGRPTWFLAKWLSETERAAFFLRLRHDTEVHSYETTVRLADGRNAVFNLSARLVVFQGERCILALTRDVTERQRHETTAAHLAAIVASSDDAIIGKDLQGIVTSWNAGAERIFGYAAAEMVGAPILRLIDVERQAEETDILTRIRQGESVRHFETVRRHRDGRAVDVSVTVSPIRDGAGRIVGASKVARDITAWKRGQTEREQLALLIEHSRDFIAMADLEGRITFMNSAARKMIGLGAGQEPGALRFTDYVAPAWQEFFQTTVIPTAREQGLWEGEMQLQEMTTGRVIDVFRATFLLRDAAGRPAAFATVTRDITGEKAAEAAIRGHNAALERRVHERTAELEAANRELEAFSYSVSHDLRAPLRAVSGFSRAALEDYSTKLPKGGVHMLETIRQNAGRMEELIEDLLKLAQLGRVPLEKSTIENERLVQSVLEDLRGEQAGRQVAVRIGELPAGFGDPSLVKQIWTNLLSNALKYTRRRSRAEIQIAAEQRGEKTVYFVRDNGTGFDPRYADKLFGAFQRLHRSEDFEGTGVGLAIVHRVVSRHGGRVWAEAAPDRGATFFFTLG